MTKTMPIKYKIIHYESMVNKNIEFQNLQGQEVKTKTEPIRYFFTVIDSTGVNLWVGRTY
ncbi:MAG: hypothetical protein IIC67_11540 [Thaumarchaeota archaeon]|nr:hypothetical protein [Nitrososphaerota archaeon]